MPLFRMPTSRAGLLAELIFGGRREQQFAAAQTAFDSALASFTNPHQLPAHLQGPPVPDSQSGATLTADQAQGLSELYAADPAAASAMLGSLLNQNQAARQNALQREIQWANVGIARDTFELQAEQFEQDILEWQASIDPILQRQLAQAAETGVVYVPDSITGQLVQTPAPGTERWEETTQQAQKAQQAAAVYNRYAHSVAQFGVIEDPSSPVGTLQDSLRTLLTFHIKDATDAGALDEGLIEQTSRLTGSAWDTREYWLGSDAASLARIMGTSQLFSDAMDRSAELTRNIQGWNPNIRATFNATRAETQMLQETLPARIQEIMALDPGAMLGGDVIDPETGLEVTPGQRAREAASVLGAQIDEITSGILGALLGRAIGR